jgi:hypothetical protein
MCATTSCYSTLDRLRRPSHWFEKIDVRGLNDDLRRAILEKVKGKLGYNEALKVLEISRGALHNYLHGIRRVPDEIVSKTLRCLEERGFYEIARELIG